MTVNQDVYRQLVEMGIESSLATGAASRFQAVDAAIEWCFGAGQSWKPEDDKPTAPPSYSSAQLGVGSATHHEIADQHSAPSSGAPSPNPTPTGIKWQYAPPPRLPPLSPKHQTSNLSAPFASNNPFRNNPPPPDAVNLIDDDDDDEQLRKALAMSVGDDGKAEEDGRRERERSVRASGVPPPSPERDEDAVMGTLFGPSEKEDTEGKMSLVPAAPPPTQVSKEEEDMNRAIADSLMTASFHSASALQNAEKPIASKREAGAPVVLYSESGSSTYAANVLQGLLAIPQFRQALDEIPYGTQIEPSRRAACLSDLIHLKSRLARTEDDFVHIDDVLNGLRNGQIPNQLPPSNPASEMQETCLLLVEDGLSGTVNGYDLDAWPEERHPYLHDPRSLFWTKINMDPPIPDAWYVHLARVAGVDFEVYDALARILWQNDPSASIESFSDILSVRLMWEYGAPRIPWKVEERIVLDRYLAANKARTLNIRAQQAVAAGAARRLKEKIETLTNYKGESTIDSLTTLVKHYESSPVSDDALVKESREELRAKLEKILATLQSRHTSLLEELQRKEHEASPAAFDTDDPELNQHTYVLRAVLYHDGAVVAGSHLYMYVRKDDGQWWKIQDHQATRVEFETIVNDKTGLFMDGGPYLLLYSRAGPRPRKPVAPEAGVAMDLVDTAIPSEEGKAADGLKLVSQDPSVQGQQDKGGQHAAKPDEDVAM